MFQKSGQLLAPVVVHRGEYTQRSIEYKVMSIGLRRNTYYLIIVLKY